MIPPIGTPYAYPSRPPATFDCWSLVEHVRASIGLNTRLHVDPGAFVPGRAATAIAQELAAGAWRDTDAPADGDVVVFNPAHVGVWIGGRVVHASRCVGVQVATWRAVRRRFPAARVVALQ